jgi:hypothetical protein
VATYFRDLAGTWNGAFDPDSGTGPASVPATFTLATNTDKTLSGTLDAPTPTNANSIACLVGPVTLQPLPEGTSYASGVAMELYGADSSGTKLWVIGEATNPDGSTPAVGEDNPADGSRGTINDGTNNTYTAFYGISGALVTDWATAMHPSAPGARGSFEVVSNWLHRNFKRAHAVYV